ncbi:helix-turn-helix transcriptional regulator [Vibrio navarrensis]
MAVITPATQFDADALPASVIGIASEIGQHDSGMHQHSKGQLLYAPKGCMTFVLDHSLCTLPPTKAVWIPPNLSHRAVMTNVVAYRSLYFDCRQFTAPTELVMIEVNPLLQALIERMAFWPWDKAEEEMRNTVALFWEEFASAKRHFFQLPLPQDARLQPFRAAMTQETFLAPSASELAERVGLSSKTVTRIFKSDTGMSYQEWRQQWRLLKSIELLSSGMCVTDVAYWLEFASDSAFIAFFKKQTGYPPLHFIKLGQNL